MIKGIHIFGPDEMIIGRYVLFEDCEDESLLYYLRAANNIDGVSVTTVSYDKKEDVLKDIEAIIEDYIAKGYKCQDIDFDLYPVEKMAFC